MQQEPARTRTVGAHAHAQHVVCHLQRAHVPRRQPLRAGVAAVSLLACVVIIAALLSWRSDAPLPELDLVVGPPRHEARPVWQRGEAPHGASVRAAQRRAARAGRDVEQLYVARLGAQGNVAVAWGERCRQAVPRLDRAQARAGARVPHLHACFFPPPGGWRCEV